LGPLEALDGERPIALPRGRGRALLARLVLDAGRVVSTDRLIEDLWSDAPPPTVQTALHGLVSDLRKRLEPMRNRGDAPAVLRTAPPGYVLAVEPTCVDANRFRRLLDEARAAEIGERAARLREALALWRGPALADFAYEPFAQSEIAALEELRLAAIEERIDAELALGRESAVVAELEALVAEHPFRERLRSQLMLGLYRSGRQADALEVYRHARRTLVEELGIEPGAALRQLEQAILRQDPSLELERRRERLAGARTPPDAAADGWLPADRRPATVAFVDVAGPPAGEGADPEAVRLVVGRSLELAAGVLGRHGASVEELLGDVVVGLFGIPTAHEDDALRAVRAVDELRGAVRALSEEFARERAMRVEIRAGIETGEVVRGVPGLERPAVSGDAVHVAGSLQRAAREGEVLVGQATRRILREAAVLEPVVVSGTDGPTVSGTAWRLLELVPGAPALARHLDAPLVGRATELGRLQAAFTRTGRRGGAYRFAVLGEAGIGKSRLARELVAALGPRARVLIGRCLAYGEGATFRALRDVVLDAAGAPSWDALSELLRDEADGQAITAHLAAAIGLTQEPARAEEAFPVMRRFFEALSKRRPLVVVLEDLHWAEATLLDLVEYLADGVRGPVFFLCLARAELIEQRPGWAVRSARADAMFLEPLGSSEIELIADRVGGGLPAETRARIAETAQGNPLFAEQLVAALRDEGVVSVPESLHALLAARLDRLGPAERDLLRSAAVVGADFTVEAVSALVPERARPFVARHLEALERKQLIRPVGAPAREFSFRHVLIQRAAYGSTTRADRAGLHERFAEWLEDEARERPPSLDEVLGYHFEQAVLERRALGMRGEHEAALAVRAGEHLAAAGLRAAWRYDVAAAANLLSRAHALLPATNPQRRALMRRLAEAYQVVGRLSEADSVLQAMLAEADAARDRSLAQVARLERARLGLLAGPDPTSLRSIRKEAERGLELFGEAADEAGSALANYILAYVHFRAGEIGAMERVARCALAHADRSARRREEMSARMLVAWALTAGPTPVPEAIRVCEQLVDVGGREHPMVLSELAILRAMLVEVEDARALVERARALARERMREPSPMLILARARASVELAAADLGSTERELRVALDLARDVGLRDALAQTAAQLSLLVVRRDRAEAADLASLSRESAPAESVAAQALWRAATARMLAEADEHREAERLAREAVRLVPAEMLNLRADLLVTLAEVVRAGGNETVATSVIRDAVELYERKGNISSAARVRWSDDGTR